ncbi:MAG: Maf family protein [Desulfovermiculus sp.]
MSFVTFHPQNLQGPFRPRKSIILASASPRRQALLTELGLHFTVLPSTFPEPNPEPDEPAGEYVQRMALQKAGAAAQTKRPGIILAADTVVRAGRHILGKPESPAQALHMLNELNAATHTVQTGCCLLDQEKAESPCLFAVSTQVTFSRHSPEVLQSYVQTGEPMGKAGGYAIQGVGSFLVSHINGSYTNVVGLPLNQTVSALLDMQAIGLPMNLTAERGLDSGHHG